MKPAAAFLGSFLLLAFPIAAGAAETPSALEIESRLGALGPAPRLFASADDWAALPGRLKTDPVAAAIYRETQRRADALLAGPLLEHTKEGRRRLGSARVFQGRIFDLATVARVEKSARHAARARIELLAAASLPDWGPNHFLDVAEYSLGVAVGLDWLHDDLTPADRDTLAKALIDRAIRPTFKAGSPSMSWLGGKNNWTQVCHAGLTAAALAVSDRDPELAARTVARAIREQAGPNAAYAPDGVYPEGPMYWEYGTTFEVILISLLEHSFRTDFGLAGFPGFLESTDFLKQVAGPGGTFFNFADCRESRLDGPVLHWFAARRREPGIASPELRRLDRESGSITGRHDALALWWREPQETAATRVLPTSWLGRGENPIAIFRTAWDDPRATFLAIKGGSPSSPHAHMDSGSFVFESKGVRWAVDPGMQDYNSLETAGVNLWDGSQDGERWGVFRLGPEAHNVLRFDGGRQIVRGNGTFSAFDAATTSATLDLSQLYPVKAVSRRVRLLPNGSAEWEDQWTTGADKPVEVAWQWLTRAEVEPMPDGVTLRQDGETLRLRMTSPTKWSLTFEDTAKLLTPTDSPNPALKRIVVRLTTLPGEQGSLRVTVVP